MANNWNSYNDDDIYAEYLSGQSDLRPEDMAIRRKQAMTDALRNQGMQSQDGKMVGNVYVGASPLQALGQLAYAYMGKKGQGEVDERQGKQDVSRKGLRTTMIEALRSRMGGSQNGMPMGRKKTPEEEMAEQAERMRQPINS